MPSNLCCSVLCNTISSDVATSQSLTCSFDLVLVASAQDNVDTNRASACCTPVLTRCNCACSVPNGHVTFLSDAFYPVVSFNCAWIGFDGTSLTTVCQLRSWGLNTCGRLGDNTTVSRASPVREISSSITWRQVSAGGYHTAALKTDGSLWTWGSNSCGQLGNNVVVDTSSPVREITSSTTWCRVAAGLTHTGAIKTDGTLWTWGNNTCGRLGDNTTVNKSSPVREITSSTTWCTAAAGSCHTAAIKTDGSLWSWGYNGSGGLGDCTTVNKSSPVREITSSTTWCQVSAGYQHAVALKTGGTLWSWGLNICGQLGDGTASSKSSPVREITSSTTWCCVSAGLRHTAAVKTDGTLWSWGFNLCGRLGDNSAVNKSSPVREISSSTTWCQVDGGGSHSSGIKTDGTLWSWGYNGQGQLGDNTSTSRSSPVREISSTATWQQVSGGSNHTAATSTGYCTTL